ncbi:MAG: histidine kinase, partial [Microbacterium sp.]
MAMLLALTGLVSMTAGGPAVLAAVSLATRRKIPSIVAVGAVSIVVGQLYTYYQPAYSTAEPPWVNFAFIVIATIAVSVFGMYVGSRRELLWTLRERARAAESEQELRVG